MQDIIRTLMWTLFWTYFGDVLNSPRPAGVLSVSRRSVRRNKRGEVCE